MVKILIETEDPISPSLTLDETNEVLKDDFWFSAKEFDYALGLFQQEIPGLKIELVYPKFGKFSASKKELDSYIYLFPSFRFSSFSQHRKLLINKLETEKQSGKNINQNKFDVLNDLDDGYFDIQIDSLEFKHAFRNIKRASFAFIMPISVSDVHWITLWIPLDKAKLTSSKAYITVIIINSIDPDETSWEFLEPLQLMLEAFFDTDVEMDIQCIIPYLQQDNSSSGPLTYFYLETIVKHYSTPNHNTDKLLNTFVVGYTELLMKENIKLVRRKLSNYMKTFIQPLAFTSKQDVTKYLNECFEKSFEFYYRNIILDRYISNEVLKKYLISVSKDSERYINYRDYFYFKPVATTFSPPELFEHFKSNAKVSVSRSLELYQNYMLKLFNVTPKLCTQLGINYNPSKFLKRTALESLGNRLQQKMHYDSSTNFFIQTSQTSESKRNVLLMPSQIPEIVIKELLKWKANNITDNVLKAYNSLELKYKNITYAMVQGIAEKCLYIDPSYIDKNSSKQIDISVESKRSGECLLLSCIYSDESDNRDTVMIGEPYDETIIGGSTYTLTPDYYENYINFPKWFVISCIDNRTRSLKYRLIQNPKELLLTIENWLKLFDPKIIRCDDSVELFYVELKELCDTHNVILVHGSKPAEEIKKIKYMIKEQNNEIQSASSFESLISKFVQDLYLDKNVLQSRAI